MSASLRDLARSKTSNGASAHSPQPNRSQAQDLRLPPLCPTLCPRTPGVFLSIGDVVRIVKGELNVGRREGIWLVDCLAPQSRGRRDCVGQRYGTTG